MIFWTIGEISTRVCVVWDKIGHKSFHHDNISLTEEPQQNRDQLLRKLNAVIMADNGIETDKLLCKEAKTGVK